MSGRSDDDLDPTEGLPTRGPRVGSAGEGSLAPGDRLFLLSDGVTECPAPDGTELGPEGLEVFLRRNADLEDRALLETLVWELHAHTGGGDFPDDVSGVLFRYAG